MKWRIPPACAYFAPTTTTDLKMTLIDQLHIEQVTRINLLSLVVDSERDGRTDGTDDEHWAPAADVLSTKTIRSTLFLFCWSAWSPMNPRTSPSMGLLGMAKGNKANKQVR